MGTAVAPLTPGMRLDHAVRGLSGFAFGGADCALPIRHALQHDLASRPSSSIPTAIHGLGRSTPRERFASCSGTSIPAKLVVAGMVSKGFSISDPHDGGMLDVVGFDAAAPGVIADFIRA